MKLYFLEADVRLVKQYARRADGTINKDPYPHAATFTSHEEEVFNCKGFYEQLLKHGELGHCLLKGTLARPLVKESRAGSTDSNSLTEYICLDLDQKIELTHDVLLGVLGVGNVSYVRQFSNSAGIEPGKENNAHFFVMLQEAMSPAQLKQWLIWMNLNIKELAEKITLTASHNALRWPLDISTCQNDKLIYTADPELIGIEDPLAGARTQYVERGTPYFALNPSTIPHPTVVRRAMDDKLAELRANAGLPMKKAKYTIDKTTGLEVLARPDAATISDIKAARGFVYFNLNGGDSWGYYHLAESPGVIRNFKGEPNYLTSELLPEYWAELQKKKQEEERAAKDAVLNPAASTVARQVLVFRDIGTGQYYNGWWDSEANEIELYPARSETQIQHFLKANGLPEVDYIPLWTLHFDPNSDVRVDSDNKVINTWKPTKYLTDPVIEGPWPTIHRVITNAIARDPVLLEHFLNWLACIVQHRRATNTAWLAHGIEGTGKGVLVNEILTPILGESAVVKRRMQDLEDMFNGFLENALIVYIDEVQVSASPKHRQLMQNIKNQITEATIPIRRMHSQSMSVTNNTNWIFASNMPDPVTVSPTDRRFNIGEFRTEPLTMNSAGIAQIKTELMAFASYLRTRPADLDKAREIIHTEQREQLIRTSKTSIDLVTEALVKGHLELFWDALPDSENAQVSNDQAVLLMDYVDLVFRAITSPNKKTRYTRDEIGLMLRFNVDPRSLPTGATKLTQMLHHHQVHVRPMAIPGIKKIVRGVEVTWDVSDEWIQDRLNELKEMYPESMKRNLNRVNQE